MRRLTVFCVLALAVAFIAPAYAEVQNVKVSGDISVYGIFRDEYTTTGSGAGRALGGTPFTTAPSEDYYATITRLRIDADLTDNVSTLVRLINERNWDTPGSAEAIELDLSSITLREMLYSPLTLVLGRQDIRWGNGLVVGDGTVGASGLTASDLSARKAFDAIRAVLDYDPLTLDIIIAKIDENLGLGTDRDVYGVNASYKLADYNAVFEAYYILAHSSLVTTGAKSGTDTSVLGVRLTGEPAANLTGELELAYQFGDQPFVSTTDKKAWAVDLGVVYAFQTDYSPKVGIKYALRSGEEATASGDNEAWDPIAEDQVNGVIYDPNTNIQFIKLSGSLVPVEKLTAGIDYYKYWLEEDRNLGKGSLDNDAGSEVDITLKYAYTEDVTLGLVAAWLFPGDAYGTTRDETASQVLGIVTVAF